jgi:hypothetical protein
MKNYVQQKERLFEADKRFEHVMAVAFDPKTNFSQGVIRCVVKRNGDVAIKGFRDSSVLAKVRKNISGRFEIGEILNIENADQIIESLIDDKHDFIGFEDPDIWFDENSDSLHLYFTIPMIGKRIGDKKYRTLIHLGHAVGKDLDSLVMTKPVLLTNENSGGAKELSIAPVNSKGFRLNLVESNILVNNVNYSTVRVAIVSDMGGVWKFGDTVFNPVEHKIDWIGGHASPGPLFPKNFIDMGDGKVLGVLNGREANRAVGDQVLYGKFSVGLFVYNYEKGIIEWVSPKPFIIDTEARNITFASQFVDVGNGEGVLYAHVDDSFVRAYDLDKEGLKMALIEFGYKF